MTRDKAPPLGLYPRFLWDEDHEKPSLDDLVQRLHEINGALSRYAEASIVSFRHKEWIAEKDLREEQIDAFADVPVCLGK